MNRTLILVGLIVVAAGLLWPWLSKLPIGQLPGDIIIRRPYSTFYFPITTMVLISLALSALLWLLNR
ncbi:MAG TPA: DUF2905 domain-containing protein [Halomonas sp.]|nr:DUF2905 domain-containing protein [Halomonas sp.]